MHITAFKLTRKCNFVSAVTKKNWTRIKYISKDVFKYSACNVSFFIRKENFKIKLMKKQLIIANSVICNKVKRLIKRSGKMSLNNQL